MGNHDEACKKLRKFSSIQKQYLILLVPLERMAGDLELAISNYEYVLNSALHFASWARNSYSYALVEKGDFDKALKFSKLSCRKNML